MQCGFAEKHRFRFVESGDFPIEYDETGLWADVFNNDAIVYSQEFMFSHASPYSNYSNGFFASKVTAISASAGTDDINGAVWLREALPVRELLFRAYWDAYTESTSDAKTCEVYTSAPYYAVGCYVCNNPYVYYAIEKGIHIRLNSSREIGLN